MPPTSSTRPIYPARWKPAVGTVPPALAKLLRNVERNRTPELITTLAALLPSVIPQITDESKLMECSSRFGSGPAWVRAKALLLVRAVEMAEDSGASWTCAVDQLIRDTGDETSEKVPPAARVAYDRLVDWLQHGITENTAAELFPMASVMCQQAVARHINARAVPFDMIGRIVDEPFLQDLWANPTLGPAQRATFIVEKARAARAPDACYLNTEPAFAFLSGFAPDARGPRGPRPAPEELARMARATATSIVANRKAGLRELTDADSRDAVLLLNIPDLEPEALAPLIRAFTGHVKTARAQFPMPRQPICGLVQQSGVTAAQITGWITAGVVQPHEIARALVLRREVLADRSLRAAVLTGANLSSELLRAMAETGPRSEYLGLFQRITRSAPTAALRMVTEGAMPADVTLGTEWLVPLLQHSRQSIRTKAIMASAHLAPAQRVAAPAVRRRS